MAKSLQQFCCSIAILLSRLDLISSTQSSTIPKEWSNNHIVFSILLGTVLTAGHFLTGCLFNPTTYPFYNACSQPYEHYSYALEPLTGDTSYTISYLLQVLYNAVSIACTVIIAIYLRIQECETLDRGYQVKVRKSLKSFSFD